MLFENYFLFQKQLKHRAVPLYTPFGEMWVEEASTVDISHITRFFTNQAYDRESGLYFMNARYYDPHLGSFISPDPGFANLNHYAYCSANPIKYTDPTGLTDTTPTTTTDDDDDDTTTTTTSTTTTKTEEEAKNKIAEPTKENVGPKQEEKKEHSTLDQYRNQNPGQNLKKDTQNEISDAVSKVLGMKWGMAAGGGKFSSACTLMTLLKAHDKNVGKIQGFDTHFNFILSVIDKKTGYGYKIDKDGNKTMLFNVNAWVKNPLVLAQAYAEYTKTKSPIGVSIEGWKEGYANYGEGRWTFDTVNKFGHSAMISHTRNSKTERVDDSWDPSVNWPAWNNNTNVYEEHFFLKY